MKQKQSILHHFKLVHCIAMVLMICPSLMAQPNDEDGPEKKHPEKLQHRPPRPDVMPAFRENDPHKGKHGNGPEGKRHQKSWSQSLEEALKNEANTISFLKEYVPQMAEKLSELKNKEDGQKRYNQQLLFVSNIYSAAIHIKDKNSTQVKRIVDDVTQKLKIRNAISRFHKATDDDKKELAKTQLKIQLNKMFDITIALEEARFEQMKQMSERIREHDDQMKKRKKPGKRKDKTQKGKRGDRRKHLQNHEDFADKLTKWKADKEKIVDMKFEQLINKNSAFPWGRL